MDHLILVVSVIAIMLVRLYLKLFFCLIYQLTMSSFVKKKMTMSFENYFSVDCVSHASIVDIN